MSGVDFSYYHGMCEAFDYYNVFLFIVLKMFLIIVLCKKYNVSLVYNRKLLEKNIGVHSTIKKDHKTIWTNLKVKMQEIADTLNKYIIETCSGFILHEHLSMRKVFSKCFPRVLTKNNDDCGGCAWSCFVFFATTEETWIIYIIP